MTPFLPRTCSTGLSYEAITVSGEQPIGRSEFIIHHSSFLVGGGGFEPPKAFCQLIYSQPLWPLGYLPLFCC